MNEKLSLDENFYKNIKKITSEYSINDTSDINDINDISDESFSYYCEYRKNSENFYFKLEYEQLLKEKDSTIINKKSLELYKRFFRISSDKCLNISSDDKIRINNYLINCTNNNINIDKSIFEKFYEDVRKWEIEEKKDLLNIIKSKSIKEDMKESIRKKKLKKCIIIYFVFFLIQPFLLPTLELLDLI